MQEKAFATKCVMLSNAKRMPFLTSSAGCLSVKSERPNETWAATFKAFKACAVLLLTHHSILCIITNVDALFFNTLYTD